MGIGGLLPMSPRAPAICGRPHDPGAYLHPVRQHGRLHQSDGPLDVGAPGGAHLRRARCPELRDHHGANGASDRRPRKQADHPPADRWRRARVTAGLARLVSRHEVQRLRDSPRHRRPDQRGREGSGSSEEADHVGPDEQYARAGLHAPGRAGRDVRRRVPQASVASLRTDRLRDGRLPPGHPASSGRAGGGGRGRDRHLPGSLHHPGGADPRERAASLGRGDAGCRSSCSGCWAPSCCISRWRRRRVSGAAASPASAGSCRRSCRGLAAHPGPGAGGRCGGIVS